MQIEWEKIKRVAISKASKQEEREVEEWRNEDKLRERFYEDAISYYRRGYQDVDDLSREGIEEAWRRVRGRTSHRRLVSRRIMGWVASAAVLSGLFLGIRVLMTDPAREITGTTEGVRLVLSDGKTHAVTVGEQPVVDIPGFEVSGKDGLKQLGKKRDISDKKEVTYAEVIVPLGAEYQITLADGTRVMLNSESRIRFPDEFPMNERRVYLQGEAYFQVARDESRPFLVDTRALTVRVLGTEFNVKAYEEARVAATLVSGRVSVTVGADSLTLVPGEQCELDKRTGELTVREADLISVLAWKNGEFVFKGVTLEEMMSELSRWYDMEVVYESENLKTNRYYIYVERSKTLEEVLDKVALTGKIKYKKSGREVIIQQQ